MIGAFCFITFGAPIAHPPVRFLNGPRESVCSVSALTYRDREPALPAGSAGGQSK